MQLQAVGVDFAAVLSGHQATAALQQATRELAGTQQPVRSPLVMNGSEYGVLANHSLVMAGYLARSRAAIRSLRDGLAAGN